MKKLIFTFLFGLFSIAAFSQAKVAIGLKAGGNFANTNIENSKSITSYHGGLFVLFKLGNMGIQPDFLYSSQGYKISTREIDFTYINVPIALKIYLPAGVNVQLGPQFGTLLNAKEANIEVLNNYKNFDWSAHVGLGWDAPFGLHFSARYILGLSDINKLNTDQIIRNNMIQISLGYEIFKLGK